MRSMISLRSMVSMNHRLWYLWYLWFCLSSLGFLLSERTCWVSPVIFIWTVTRPLWFHNCTKSGMRNFCGWVDLANCFQSLQLIPNVILQLASHVFQEYHLRIASDGLYDDGNSDFCPARNFSTKALLWIRNNFLSALLLWGSRCRKADKLFETSHICVIYRKTCHLV